MNFNSYSFCCYITLYFINNTTSTVYTMFIIVVFIYFVHVEARVNPLGPTVVNDFSNCIMQITDNDFKKPGLLIFANNNNASTPVRNIRNRILAHVHRSSTFSVQVASSNNENAICGADKKTTFFKKLELSKYIPTANYFILIIDGHEEFYYLMRELIHWRTWNPNAKFIVLLYNFTDDKNNEVIVENLLTCLYKYYVINIVVMVPQENNIRKANIYSWRPYDPPKYCGYANETAKTRLKLQNVCEKGALKLKGNVFENKIPSDMKGCTLDVIALESEPFISADEEEISIEKELVNEVFGRLNLRPIYDFVHLSRGERETQMWDGALGELVTQKGNVVLGGIFPDFDVHEDFDCSASYLANEYTWVVPRAYLSPRWVALVVIFQKSVWLFVFVTFFVCAGIWKFIGLWSGDSPYDRKLRHSFLNTWLCTLGLCTYSRPTTNSLRTFFIFLNLYCVTFITAYTAKLIDVLRYPTYDYQIETVEELINSGLKFGGLEVLQDIFNSSDDPIDRYIFEKWVKVEDIQSALIDVAINKNFSLLYGRLELAHKAAMMPELSDIFGEDKYYAFKMNVFSVPLEMIGLKGFPFVNEFSKTLSLLKQIGVNSKLRQSFFFHNLMDKAKLQRLKIHMPDIAPLSMRHLQGGFLALLFGYTAGTLTFILEIISNTDFIKAEMRKYKKIFKKRTVTFKMWK